MKRYIKNKRTFMSLVLFISIMATTIVHAAYTTKLQIEGEAILRAHTEIRITGIELIETSGGAYETYTPRYTTNTTSTYVTLPSDSYVIYEITVENYNNIDYVIYKIEEISHNENVNYESNIKVNEDIINSTSNTNESEIKFTIKIKNNTSEQQEEILFLKYIFEEAKYKAIELSYDDDYSDCKTVQCTLDNLARIIKENN